MAWIPDLERPITAKLQTLWWVGLQFVFAPVIFVFLSGLLLTGGEVTAWMASPLVAAVIGMVSLWLAKPVNPWLPKPTSDQRYARFIRSIRVWFWEDTTRLSFVVVALALPLGLSFLLQLRGFTGSAWTTAAFILSVPAIFIGGNSIKAYLEEKRFYKELTRARFRMLVDYPTLSDHIVLGQGYRWSGDHHQRYNDLRLDMDRLRDDMDKKGRGNTALFGLGWKEAEELEKKNKVGVAIPESDLNTHLVVLATTGSGKTRLAEFILGQEICTFGNIGVAIDPKGDAALERRIHRECIRRGIEFLRFDLGNPARSVSYNPLESCDSVDQIKARMGALMPDDGNQPFFKTNAIATCGIVANVVCPIRDFLKYGQSIIEDLEKIRCGTREVYKGLPKVLKSDYWTPRISIFGTYGINRPHCLLAYAIRICWLHAYKGSIDAVETVDLAGAHTLYMDWVNKYKNALHPVEEGWEGPAEIKAVYAKISPENRVRIRYLIEELRGGGSNAIAALWDHAGIQQGQQGFTDTFDKRVSTNSTLQSIVGAFAGEKAKLVEATRSAINFDKMIDQKQFAYFNLAALRDRVAANNFTKVILEALMNWAGRKSEQEDKRPFILFVDEVSSVIPESFSDFLARTRSAGFRVIGIGQVFKDFEARLGSVAKAEQCVGNFGSCIQMKSQSQFDGEQFAKSSGAKVPIKEWKRSLGVQSAYGNSGDRAIAGHRANENFNLDTPAKTLVPDDVFSEIPMGQGFIRSQDGVYYFAVPLVQLWGEDWEAAARLEISKHPIKAHRISRVLGRAYDMALESSQWDPAAGDAAGHVRQALDRGALREAEQYSVDQADALDDEDMPMHFNKAA